MKNKIQKFSKGDFQLIRPDVIFDETNLVLIIGEGEVYKAEYEDSFTRLLFVFILRTRDSREIRRGLSLHMTDVGFVRDM